MEAERRIREGLFGGGVIAALFLAGLLTDYLKSVPVSPSYYQLMSSLHFICFAAVVSSLVALPLRLKQPPSSFVFAGRVLLAVLFALLGCKAGLGYIHLCSAGSRLVEGAAVLGTPLAAVAMVVWIKRLPVAVGLAALSVTAVWFLARPYLDLVHGD